MMAVRRHPPLPLLLLLLAAPAAAQGQEAPPLSFSGNLQLSSGFQRIPSHTIYDLDGSSSQLEEATRKVNSVLRVAQPGAFSALLDIQYQQTLYDDDESTRVNQLYAIFDLTPRLKMRLGKQRVLWGHGLSYIPTDFINPPLDPSGLDLAKEGVTALSLDYINSEYALTLLAHCEDEANCLDSVGLKLSSYALAGIDFAGVLYHAPSIGNAVGGSFSFDAGEIIDPLLGGLVISGGLALHERSRYPEVVSQQAGEESYYLPGPLGKRGPYTSWMVAASHQATDRFNITGEYYHIGDAYSEDEYRDMVSCLSDRQHACRGLSAGMLNHFSLGRSQRDYATLSFSLSSLTEGVARFSDTFGVDLGVLQGMGDHSRNLSLAFHSTYWDQAEITWRNLYTDGADDTEFGTAPFRWYSELSVTFAF